LLRYWRSSSAFEERFDQGDDAEGSSGVVSNELSGGTSLMGPPGFVGHHRGEPSSKLCWRADYGECPAGVEFRRIERTADGRTTDKREPIGGGFDHVVDTSSEATSYVCSLTVPVELQQHPHAVNHEYLHALPGCAAGMEF